MWRLREGHGSSVDLALEDAINLSFFLLPVEFCLSVVFSFREFFLVFG